MIFIVGNSGAGKSTLAEWLAKENDFALLGEDDFVFKMNPGSMVERVARSKDRKIGMKNMMSVLANYLDNGNNVVIEGAFVDGPVYLDDFAKIAKKYGYEFCPIMLIVSRKKSIRRKKKKGYVVPEKIDQKLRKAAEDLGYTDKCIALDTGKYSLKRTKVELADLIKRC